MDKIHVQKGFVVSKHDYEFLQNSIEEALRKVLSSAADAVSFSQTGAVVIGFNLLIVNPTQVRLYNNNSINSGYLVNRDGKVIEFKPATSSGIVIDFIAANIYNNAAPAVDTTYVCAVRLVTSQATENPETHALNFTTPGRISLLTTIPGDSGGLYHDRIIEGMEFKFIPLSVFTSLTNNEWIEIGRFTTALLLPQISGTTIDFNYVTYLSAVIRPASVGLDKLTLQIQELLELLFVVLDYPSYARLEYSGVLNKYLFTDVRRPLLLRDGSRELYYWEAEFGVQQPIVIHQPDIVLGARVLKSSVTGDSIISVTNTFSSPTSVVQSFVATGADNFGVVYPNGYTLVALSVFINSVATIIPATDKLEFQIVDPSDNVIFTNEVLLQSLTPNSWYTFSISPSLVNVFQWGVTYRIRFQCVSGAVSFLGVNINNIRYRLFHRPPAGQYGLRTNNFSLCIYDKYGQIDVFNSNRLAATGIGRYIPYAADLSGMNSSPSSFTVYTDPFTNPSYVNKYVAIDVTTGRFTFGTLDYPADHLEVFIYCNIKVKHSELNSVTLQRNSRDVSYKFENIESALERLSKISESYLLVKKQKSDLIPVSLVNNTYKTLSNDVQYVDSTGFNLTIEKGTVPESQFKIDAFYTGDDLVFYTTSIPVQTTAVLARRASGVITYTSGSFVDGHTFEINGIVYEFNAIGDPIVGPSNVPVTIGTSTSATLNNLVNAINSSDSEVIASVSGNEVTITFKEYGSSKNYRSFRKISTMPYLKFENWDKSVEDPLYFTGGRLGTEIEFVPRFANHQGLILFTGNITPHPSVSLRVELYKGPLGDDSNFVARCLIPSANLISNSAYFVFFNNSNVEPIGANYSVIPGETYHYQISKTGAFTSVIEIQRYAVVPFGLAFFQQSLSNPPGVITITHNLDDNYPFVSVFNSSGVEVLPSNITVLNSNQISVDLSVFTSIAGWRCVVYSGKNLDLKSDLSFTNTMLTAGVLTFNHGLSSNNVQFVVFNDSNEIIIPFSVTRVSGNTANIDLSPYTVTGTWRVRAVVFSSLSSLYDASLFRQEVVTFTNANLTSGVLTINHNYQYNNTVVKIIDNSGDDIYPDLITNVNSNTTNVDLTSFGSISGTWRAIIIGPSLNPNINPVDDRIKFQEIFEMSGGLATLPIGFDLFDDTGSLFKSSLARSVSVDNFYTLYMPNYPPTGMSSVHWQVQDEYFEGGDNFPPFTPSSLDTVFTASFRIFVSEWTVSAAAKLFWRVVDLTDNSVVGTEFSELVTALQDPLGNTPLTSNVSPVSDPADVVEIVLPAPIPSLSMTKQYRLEIKLDSPTSTLYIATDGNPVAVDRKLWYRRFYSASFTALPLNLTSPLWENLKLPTPYYVAVDVVRGRYKFHPNAPLVLVNKPVVQVDFYFKVSFPQLTSEAISRPNGETVEDSFIKYRNFILSGVFYGWDFVRVDGTGSPQYPQFKEYFKDNERLQIEFIYDTNNNVIERRYRFSKNNGVNYGLIGREELTYTFVTPNYYLSTITWYDYT